VQEGMDDQASRNDRIPGEMVPVKAVIGMKMEDALPGIPRGFFDCCVYLVGHYYFRFSPRKVQKGFKDSRVQRVQVFVS
jgi:hypothetical protein